MYPYIRALSVLWAERRSEPIGMFDTHVSQHRAWPWDTDMFGELNNGRILTLYELGRWGLTARTGMMPLLTRHKLGFAVAGASVHYRRRIPLFSRYEMRTRIAGFDDKFFYADQSMWQGETACNQLLLRAAFTKGRKLLPPSDAMALMGEPPESPEMPDWIHRWIEADRARPWPPEIPGP